MTHFIKYLTLDKQTRDPVQDHNDENLFTDLSNKNLQEAGYAHIGKKHPKVVVKPDLYRVKKAEFDNGWWCTYTDNIHDGPFETNHVLV